MAENYKKLLKLIKTPSESTPKRLRELAQTHMSEMKRRRRMPGARKTRTSTEILTGKKATQRAMVFGR